LKRRPTVAIAALVMSLLAACSAPPMPVPEVFAQREPSPLDTAPVSRQTPTVDVIYATNRVADPRDSMRYSDQRSRSVGFGVATVDLGADSWEQLAERERLRPRRVIAVEELGRFAPTPTWRVRTAEGRVPNPESVAINDAARAELAALVGETMLPEDDGVVNVFVHGFNVTFRNSLISAATISELLGRRGVMLAFSWPSGSPGLLRGYSRDRESGEFSVFHLRGLLRALARIPEIRRVNLIAHSRGTDVLASAVRELILVERAAGLEPKESLKFGHLIFLAPDLDLEVFGQRLVADFLNDDFISSTVYFTPQDRALGIANWLFRGVLRLGAVDIARLSPETKKRLDSFPIGTEFILVATPTRGLGHSYYRECPSVSSDLFLILVENRLAGAEHGRPLARDGGVWMMNAGYPNVDELADERGHDERGHDERE